jgi:hypothetical protein
MAARPGLIATLKQYDAACRSNATASLPMKPNELQCDAAITMKAYARQATNRPLEHNEIAVRCG